MAAFLLWGKHGRATAEDGLHIDTVAWQVLRAYCDSTHADEILLIHGDEKLGWRSADCDSSRMATASMVKSWTGLVVGTLLDKGLIGSVEDRVCSYIPEWADGCEKNVRVRHLLTMCAGDDRRGPRGVMSQADMNRYVVNMMLDTLPDVRHAYSNESTQLLGLFIERASGQRAEDYFRQVLFDPLGMDSTSLARDSVGNAVVFGGCRTTVEDAAQVGLLMLKKGEVGGKRIVSEHWIEASTEPSRLAPYYGYHWWIDSTPGQRSYAAMGDLGQLTIVFPDQGLAFVRRQNCDLSSESLSMSWMGPEFLEMIADVVRQKR